MVAQLGEYTKNHQSVHFKRKRIERILPCPTSGFILALSGGDGAHPQRWGGGGAVNLLY
jgi:hypothetical protein